MRTVRKKSSSGIYGEIMKTWTVVVELTEDADFSAQEVELMFTRMLANAPLHHYKVYEVTQCKYGPEPEQVILKENKRP